MGSEDRRHYPRVKLITKVTNVAGEFFHYYYSRDLSLGGIFLETREPFSVGTQVNLEFPLPGISRRVSVQGKVMRMVASEERDPAVIPGMGIQFGVMDEETKGMVAEFIANIMTR